MDPLTPIAVALCVAAASAGPSLALWRAWKVIDRLQLKLQHRERQLAEHAYSNRKTTAISWPFPPPLPDGDRNT